MSDQEGQETLGVAAARKLANTTKTAVQFAATTPRWLTQLLPWKPLESGQLRVNRVDEGHAVQVLCTIPQDTDLPSTYVEYARDPREYTLTAISTVLKVSTRVSDLYGSPFDQVREQLRLTVEAVKERQEDQLLNNEGYGLLHSAVEGQRVKTRKGPPTPDDLDELISRVWKEPAYFLAHPRAIAAIGRECTRRGVPPATVTLFGSPFLTWRGIPIVPSDKIPIVSGKSSVLLVRVGEKKQGVVGLFQPGLPGEQSPGLSVRFMGIDAQATASYLVSLYCSAAVLTPDAIGVLEDVEVGYYHEYA